VETKAELIGEGKGQGIDLDFISKHFMLNTSNGNYPVELDFFMLKKFPKDKIKNKHAKLEVYSSKIANLDFNESNLSERITQSGIVSKFVQKSKDLYEFIEAMQQLDQIMLYDRNDLIYKFLLTKILANTDSNPGNILVEKRQETKSLIFTFIDSRSKIQCYEFDCILNFFKRISNLLKSDAIKDKQETMAELKKEFILHLTYTRTMNLFKSGLFIMFS
jgi:hypothetical protein